MIGLGPPLWKILAPLLLIAFLAVAQNTNLFNVGGIKPNITLACLLALSFFINEAVYYFLLVFIGGAFLRFEPGLEVASFVLMALALAAFFVNKKLPGKQFFNNIFLVMLSTLVFYGLLDFSFLFDEFGSVVIEMVYNSVLGSILFLCFNKYFFKQRSGFNFTP